MIHSPISLPPHTSAKLLMAAALASTGIGLTIWSSSAQDEASAARSRTEHQHTRLKTELDALRQQHLALQPALTQWKTLASLGALTAATPSAWMSEASRIFERQGITAEPPRFSSTPTLETKAEAATARILTHATEIDVTLRHEGRLAALITALTAMRGAVVLPRACTLTRTGEAAKHGIQARCRLDWLTVSVPLRNPAP